MLRKNVEEFVLKHAEEFVFADVELFFRTLQHLGYKIHIITLGTEWFQIAKIEGSAIAGFINGYIATQDPTKCSAVTTLCYPATDNIVLFDDSKKVIDAVKRLFPRICAVQVLREDNPAKVSSNADAIAKNLGEAIGAILNRPQ